MKNKTKKIFHPNGTKATFSQVIILWTARKRKVNETSIRIIFHERTHLCTIFPFCAFLRVCFLALSLSFFLHSLFHFGSIFSSFISFRCYRWFKKSCTNLAKFKEKSTSNTVRKCNGIANEDNFFGWCSNIYADEVLTRRNGCEGLILVWGDPTLGDEIEKRNRIIKYIFRPISLLLPSRVPTVNFDAEWSPTRIHSPTEISTIVQRSQLEPLIRRLPVIAAAAFLPHITLDSHRTFVEEQKMVYSR